MRTGEFQATGWEGGLSWRAGLGYLLLVLGVLQFFLWLYLPLLHPNGPVSSTDILLLSLLVSIASLIGMLVAGFIFTRVVGTYNISFVDRSEEGAGVELTYINKRGFKRVSIPVNSLRPHPRSPLYRPTFSRGVSYVGGTNASLTIKLEHKGGPLRLELGFSSVDGMNMVYEQLRPSLKRQIGLGNHKD